MLINPAELVIGDGASVDEILQPGVSEWVLTRTDGQTMVVPVASVIRDGEGNLQRADQGTIVQDLLPMEISFITSNAWSDENRTAGSSTLTLLMLGLLGIVLAGEQILAYWASYHVAPTARVVR